MAKAHFDFLEVFIHKLLDDSGFEGASEETRNQYVPMLMAEAERRLGLVIIEKLSSQDVEDFTKLLEGEEINQQAMSQFLQERLPTFPELAQKVLQDFELEFKKTLQEAV